MKLIHSFKPMMLQNTYFGETVNFRKLPINIVRQILANKGIESCIGFAGMAKALENLLGQRVECYYGRTVIGAGEQVISVHYGGGRWDYHTHEMPIDGRFYFWSIMAMPRPDIGDLEYNSPQREHAIDIIEGEEVTTVALHAD